MGLYIFRRKIVVVLTFASGLAATSFLFQNCSRSGIGVNDLENFGLATNLHASSNSVPGDKINLKNENVQSVDLLVQSSQTVEKNGRSFSLKSNDMLKVDLISGQVLLESEMATNSVHCLSAELKSELVDILKSAKICNVQAAVENNVCIQSVERSYAEIHTAREDLKLGNNEDKCASQYIDLCDDQSKMLQGLAQAIKNKLDTLVCK